MSLIFYNNKVHEHSIISLKVVFKMISFVPNPNSLIS